MIRILDDGHDSLGQLAKEAAEHFTFGTNLRGSAGYRKALAQVYIRRLMESLTGRSVSKG